MSKGKSQVIILIILVVLAAVGAGGYWWWTQRQPEQATTTQTQQVVTTPVAQPELKDYRTDGKMGTGMALKQASDVDGLAGDAALKEFLKKQMTPDSQLIIDRVMGLYAVGMQTSERGGGYTVWGPKDGTGEIQRLAGTQNEGFSCSELTAGKVPSGLVDATCYEYGEDNNPRKY